jgi:hypothetical protein
MPAFFTDKRTALLITVAALGYFVDIYDLVLFNVVKRESLEHIMGAGSCSTRWPTSPTPSPST